MATTTVSLALVCYLLSALSPVALGKVMKTSEQKVLALGPRNTASLQGSTVELTCFTDGTPGSNIQWIDPTGDLISDGSTLIESHPNRARYSLNIADARTFNLVISRVVLADAGLYTCSDSNAAHPSKVRFSAELIVLESNPKCNSTVPDYGAVIEGRHHAIECTQSFQASPGVRPLMTWTGPPIQFSYSYTYSTDTVRSSIGFYVNKSADSRQWTCKTNFTRDQFSGSDRDTIPPDYSVLSSSPQMHVYWAPTNISVNPLKASYEIGETVTCYADSWPTPSFKWQSLRTSDIKFSASFTIREDLVGYQMMRCTASNVIMGITYSKDIFMDLYVKSPSTTTTTTTPSTTTTTTEPPAGFLLSCQRIKKSAGRSAASGEYSIYNQRLKSEVKVYCEMGLNGGGYTFVKPFDLPNLIDSDIQTLFTDRSNFLMRVRLTNGKQLYGVLKQLPQHSSTPLALHLNGFTGFTRPLNEEHFGAPYLFYGFLPAGVAGVAGTTQGFQINGYNLTFVNCDGTPNSYLALFANFNEIQPTTYGAGWTSPMTKQFVQQLRPVHSKRVMPTEYFSFMEMHQGGCGAFAQTDGSSDLAEILSVSIGFR